MPILKKKEQWQKWAIPQLAYEQQGICTTLATNGEYASLLV